MLLQAIKSAQAKAKQALNLLYEDSCTVYCHCPVKDEDGSTSYEEHAVYENIPCRISFSSIPTIAEGDVPAQKQSVKLFLASDHQIAQGVKIAVHRQGETRLYKCASIKAYYQTHQEINLEVWEPYA